MVMETPLKKKRNYVHKTEKKEKVIENCRTKLQKTWEDYKKELVGKIIPKKGKKQERIVKLELSKNYLVYEKNTHES